MSLDNVLAVAAVARNNPPMLVAGLMVSIVPMGLPMGVPMDVLGGALAKLLDRQEIIADVGLALIACIGLELLWEGMAAAYEALQLGLPLPAHGGH